MSISRSALKAGARELCLGSKPSPILVGLLYAVIALVLGNLQSSISGAADYYEEFYTNYFAAIRSGDLSAMVLPALPPAPTLPGGSLTLGLSLMGIFIGVGFTIFCMQTARRENASVGNLFDGFGHFLRVLGLYILIYIFTALWTLLLIVPGFIAAYSYRQALYLMLDHPEMSIMECISESKRMMQGHKAELFWLDMSFIGWHILGGIPLVNCWVYPYTELTYVLYYQALAERPEDAGAENGGRGDWQDPPLEP